MISCQWDLYIFIFILAYCKLHYFLYLISSFSLIVDSRILIRVRLYNCHYSHDRIIHFTLPAYIFPSLDIYTYIFRYIDIYIYIYIYIYISCFASRFALKFIIEFCHSFLRGISSDFQVFFSNVAISL